MNHFPKYFFTRNCDLIIRTRVSISRRAFIYLKSLIRKWVYAGKKHCKVPPKYRIRALGDQFGALLTYYLIQSQIDHSSILNHASQYKRYWISPAAFRTQENHWLVNLPLNSKISVRIANISTGNWEQSTSFYRQGISFSPRNHRQLWPREFQTPSRRARKLEGSHLLRSLIIGL